MRLTRLLLLTIVPFLMACGGTLTVTGEGNYEHERNARHGGNVTEKGCNAVCNQTNPNGRCGEWLQPKGQNCLDELQGVKKTRSKDRSFCVHSLVFIVMCNQ